MSRRFPARVYQAGHEPDPRFTLANERTFLAWIRTSLALIAAGIALEALGLGLQSGLRLAASLTLIISGIGTPVQAWIGWALTERALRNNQPLPSPAFSLPIGVGVIAAGILALLGILFA